MMTENQNISAEFWEREVEILSQMSTIRAEIELEVEMGRAEIEYLFKRHVDLDRLSQDLKAIRQEREMADAGQSEIPTIPPPRPTAVQDDPLEENLSLYNGK